MEFSLQALKELFSPTKEVPVYQQMLDYLTSRNAIPKQTKDFVNDVRPSEKEILSMIEEQFTSQYLKTVGAATPFTNAYAKLRPEAPGPSIDLVSTDAFRGANGQRSGGATAATETLLLLDLATRASRQGR